MSQIKDGNSAPPHKGWLRGLAHHAGGLFMPATIVADHGGLQRAEALARSGHGLLLLMNHFSKRDAFQVLQLLYGREVWRRRPTLAPVAAYRATSAIYTLADLFDIRLCPMITPEAVKRYGHDPAGGQSALVYAQQAIETLRAGGIVPLAPQAGRRPRLDQPTMRPVSLLMAQARRRRVREFTLLFVGLGIRGEEDYALGHVGGLNALRCYELRIGPAFAYDETISQAGGLRQLDNWAYEQLRALVPPSYRGSPAS